MSAHRLDFLHHTGVYTYILYCFCMMLLIDEHDVHIVLFSSRGQ